MAVIVNTNVQSLIAQRNLNKATNGLNTTTERLSTGLRINRASDDAAGLFVAKGLEAQLRGSQQCQTNISLGINVLQIAEGDLTTIQDNVMRIKDLATQAANGVYSTSARTAMANEVNARVAEINRIAAASEFNGIKLLDGSGFTGGLRLQVGHGSGSTANAIVITDVFTNSTAASAGIGLAENATAVNTAFATATAAAGFIATCEASLQEISTKRAAIGVAQSRLEMASEGLATTIENVSSAKSTVMDTDIASTTADYTKNQILQQISSAMLTQANQAPSIALSLIG